MIIDAQHETRKIDNEEGLDNKMTSEEPIPKLEKYDNSGEDTKPKNCNLLGKLQHSSNSSSVQVLLLSN